jgi:hypothetical protein
VPALREATPNPDHFLPQSKFHISFSLPSSFPFPNFLHPIMKAASLAPSNKMPCMQYYLN